MEKFIPYEKLSKKEKRKIDQARRQTWGELNPVTRKPENSKAYNSNKARNWKRDYHEPVPGLLYLLLSSCYYLFLLQSYNLGCDSVAESFIMLYEKDRGLVGQKQLLDLHSGDHIDVIHGFVPNVKILRLTDGASQQDFLFLSGA